MTETADTDEADDVCGFTYDHTLELLGERDGCRSYVCRECGTEIHELED